MKLCRVLHEHMLKRDFIKSTKANRTQRVSVIFTLLEN
ncbi:hypothetical protein IMSAGC009_03329 [Lachnospiraceae bacterium]|nr:hypothetical protein IMSAGC009_03329 [Lachnospiraceae bacterium]